MVAERVLTRKTLNNLISMWVDKGRRAGFRSLYLYAQRRRENRQVSVRASKSHHHIRCIMHHRAHTRSHRLQLRT